MALELAEVVIEAALVKLRAGVAARIATINAEKADSVTVGTPSTDDFYPYGVTLLPRTPAIVVTDGGTPENGSFRADGPHSFEYDLQLLVLVADRDADRAHLGRKLLRLERAVIEALWDDAPKERLTVTGVAADTFPYIRPARVIPGPVFEPRDDSSFWESTRIVVFHVTKIEAP